MSLVETEVAKCKNCGSEVAENYCSTCGQKKIDRLTSRYILTLLQNDLFDFDRGLVYTFIQLWVHPGKTVRSYVNGRTKTYYSPLKYLIFWGAVALLVMQVNLTKSNAEKSVEELIYNDHAFLSDESFEDLGLLYATSLRDYTNIYYIFLVPFLTVVSSIIYYRKKYHFAELMVMYLYLAGQIVFMVAALALVAMLTGPEYASIPAMVSLLFILYLMIKSHKEFFEERWVTTIIKSLFILYTGQIVYLMAAYLVVSGIKVI